MTRLPFEKSVFAALLAFSAGADTYAQNAQPVVVDELYPLTGEILSGFPQSVPQFEVKALVTGVRYPFAGELVSEHRAVLPANAPQVAGIQPGVPYPLEGQLRSGEIRLAPAQIERAQRAVDIAGQIREEREIAVANESVKTGAAGDQDLDGLSRTWAKANAVLARIQPTLASTIRVRRLGFADGSSGSEVAMVLSPAASYSRKGRTWGWNAKYAYDQGQYWGTRENSFSEHRLDGKYSRNIATRSAIEIGAKYVASNDRPARDVNTLQMVDQSLLGLNVKFQRGTARDRLRFAINFSDTRTSFDADADTNRYGNNEVSLGGDVIYQFRPRLRFSTGITRSRFSYDDGSLNSSQTAYRIATDVIPNARFHAQAAIGFQQKEFDHAGGQTASTPSWDVSLQWRPRRHSAFKLTTAKRFVESYTLRGGVFGGDETVDQTTTLSWKQTWNPRLSSSLDLSVNHADFLGETLVRDSLALNLNYRVRQWLTLGMSANLEKQELSEFDVQDSSDVTFKAQVKF